ncbi:MAG: hypothetical protein HKO57_08460 [Akkermansiaceae bacterium]|nr:hypothetical protein [Akkermansiaceae bacterium]
MRRDFLKLGTARFFFRNVSDWRETTLTVGDPRLSVDGRVLSITPPAGLADGERRIGAVTGWESDPNFALLNPRGNGTW